ncbi:MAG: hypothetical protein IPN29_15435 [Saprospiraceae bacterium]|nr:hypothetical protein [Saprospiraceae bacterium]
MNIKVLIPVMLILFSSLSADAQRSRTRRTREVRTADTTNIMDKLNFEIRMGNVGISNGFNLSLKPSVGYKFTKAISAGVGTRFYYQFVSVFATDDYSLFDYGAFVYGRAKLGQSFYLQGEYAVTKFDYSRFVGVDYTETYPLVGAGYLSGGDKWKYGIEVMFPLSEAARDYGVSLEYWINFSYQF